MKTVNIYVQTSIKGIGRKDGRFMYVMESPTPKGAATYNPKEPIEFKHMTVEEAELSALCDAVKHLNQNPAELNLYITSVQLRNNIVYFMKNWAKRNWRRADGKLIHDWQKWKCLYENTQIYFLQVHLNTHGYTNWLLTQF